MAARRNVQAKPVENESVKSAQPIKNKPVVSTPKRKPSAKQGKTVEIPKSDKPTDPEPLKPLRRPGDPGYDVDEDFIWDTRFYEDENTQEQLTDWAEQDRAAKEAARLDAHRQEVMRVMPATVETTSQPAPDSANIPAPEPTQYRPEMAVSSGLVLMDGGVAYRPLPAAAEKVQAPRRTVHSWVINKVEFAGRPLEARFYEPTNSYYIAEESIDRMANRFVKWPSGEPAGAVTIGATEDQSGYLGTTEAARVIGVTPQTMWLWAKDGNAPTNDPLDMVKCMTSERVYISEKDINALKKAMPKTGVKRGRRPQQLTPQ